jgi:hypothetical protein
MEGRDDLDITLGYSEKHDNGMLTMDKSQTLNFELVGESAVGVFSISHSNNLLPYLRVSWFAGRGGFCSVSAKSKVIRVNDA